MDATNEILVATDVGCQHCGSGVLKVLLKEKRLRCAQCLSLDLELTDEQVVSIPRDHAWAPPQSGRAGA